MSGHQELPWLCADLRADDAPLFQQVNETGGMVVADAHLTLEMRCGSVIRRADNFQRPRVQIIQVATAILRKRSATACMSGASL